MKDTWIKVFVIPVANFLWFVLWKLVFRTVKTNLWKSDRPLATFMVFWKENTWFAKKRSMQLGLDTLSKHVFFSRFFKGIDIKMSLNKPSTHG